MRSVDWPQIATHLTAPTGNLPESDLGEDDWREDVRMLGRFGYETAKALGRSRLWVNNYCWRGSSQEELSSVRL